MRKKVNKNLRLLFCGLFCVMLIATSLIVAIGPRVNAQDNTSKENNLFFLRFLIHDWNWWTNKPNMFMIPSGNVGIGTTSPSEKLDVNGSINATPILGKWAQNYTRSSPGNYTWDIQLLNTNPAYLNWTAGQDHIVILKSGYYQINVNVCQYLCQPALGIIDLKRNNENISRYEEFGGYCYDYIGYHFSDVGYFNVNDSIVVYSFDTQLASYRIGGDLLSTMNIIRLN